MEKEDILTEYKMKEIEKNILNDLNFLKLKLQNSLNNEIEFCNFFRDFICELPENFELGNFFKLFEKDLEIDEDSLNIFKLKSKENQAKFEQHSLNKNKKRNFQEYNKHNNDANIVNTDLLFKKKKTIDNYFTNEIGFRNVKDKINSQNLITGIDNKKIPLRDCFTPSSIINPFCNNETQFMSLPFDSRTNFLLQRENSETNSQKSNNCLTSKNLSSNLSTIISSSKITSNDSNFKTFDFTKLTNSSNTSNNNPLINTFGSISNPNNSIAISDKDRSNTVNLGFFKGGIGINSRLAGSITSIVNAKKPRRSTSTRSKKGKDKIIEKFFNRIQTKIDEDARESKNKSSDNSNFSNSNTNILKQVVQKQFYAREKEIITPSPLRASITKYSKKRLENENSINNSININSNSSSNISSNSLEGKFNVLKCNHNRCNGKIDVTPSKVEKTLNNSINYSNNSKSIYGLQYEATNNDNNLIVLTKIRYNQESVLKNNEQHTSEDEILCYSTPTKTENIKFGMRSPHNVSRVNLMNLIKQMKHDDK